MKFFIAFALLSVVVYGRFFIRARRARAYNLLAQREADRGILMNACNRYETMREQLYLALNVSYVPGMDLQPHVVEIAEARERAYADPDAWAIRGVIESFDEANRVMHEVGAEYNLKYKIE